MTDDTRPRAIPQAVLDAMPGAVAQLSPSGEILGVNTSWSALRPFGCNPSSTNVTVGENYLTACDDAAGAGAPGAREIAAVIRAVVAGRDAHPPIEYPAGPPGQTRWYELFARKLDGDGYHGALITHVDITTLKATADAAQQSDAQYRAIFESAPVGIYQTSGTGTILAANQALAQIVGVASPEDLIGESILQFYLQPEIRADWISKEMAVSDIEVEWQRRDGAHVWIQLAARGITDKDGRTLYYEVFVYDISERKRLEAQLMQAQKMESVGRLAGGIAHDFNNLLTVMIGYAEMMNDVPDLPESLRPAVREILLAARRAAELTGRMLTFARKQRVQPRPVLVDEVVHGVEALLRRIIGEDVRLTVSPGAGQEPVLIDPAQLEQVLMNLAVNARDAMPQGGTLTIATSLVTIREEGARRTPGMRPGRHVRVAITDTGTGMDEVTLARVFEPFFTTKEPGKGTGLGLSMCYGIVKQAGGYIGCESSLGAGTTCVVLLPAITAPTRIEHVEPAVADGPSVPHATARILVVEDEAIVRRFVADVLIASGHDVMVTGSPHEGLELASRAEGIDLLVTDVVMPQMDGIELASRVRALRPNVRVLLMSGYQDRSMKPRADDTELLLEKPFTSAQLRDSVARALGSGRPD